MKITSEGLYIPDEPFVLELGLCTPVKTYEDKDDDSYELESQFVDGTVYRLYRLSLLGSDDIVEVDWVESPQERVVPAPGNDRHFSKSLLERAAIDYKELHGEYPKAFSPPQ